MINKEIRRFFKDYPWIKKSIRFYPVKHQGQVNTKYNFKTRKLEIAYPKNNPFWIFHELGHIAALCNHKKLYEENYGLPISDIYSYEAILHELVVFSHQTTLGQVYGGYQKDKSIVHIKQQMELSLKCPKEQRHLKALVSQFIQPMPIAKTIDRLKMNLWKL